MQTSEGVPVNDMLTMEDVASLHPEFERAILQRSSRHLGINPRAFDEERELSPVNFCPRKLMRFNPDVIETLIETAHHVPPKPKHEWNDPDKNVELQFDRDMLPSVRYEENTNCAICFGKLESEFCNVTTDTNYNKLVFVDAVKIDSGVCHVGCAIHS